MSDVSHLTRDDATLLVNNVTKRHMLHYAMVEDADALELLGEIDFNRMKRNAVRRLGPTPGTTYPWNVIDYLSGYRTPLEIQQASQVRKD